MGLEPIRGPDGREWQVSVRRVGWPTWRDSQYDPSLDEPLFTVVAYLAAPIFWFVIPLVLVVLETPVALMRAIGSRRRWIDATCGWPADVTITWESTADSAHEAARYVRGQLGLGYENLTPPGATFVRMTKPPGVDD